MRAAPALEAAPVSLSSALSRPTSPTKRTTTAATGKKKSHAKAPPVPLDEIIAGSDKPPLPSTVSLSARGNSSVADSHHARRVESGNVTSDDSKDVIKRLKDRLKREERENAELEKHSDQSHQVAMARMEEEIADLKTANVRLHADLDMATTLLNQTQQAAHASEDVGSDAVESAPSAETESDAAAPDRNVSFHDTATVFNDTRSSDSVPGGNVSRAQSERTTAEAGVEFSSSDAEATDSAEASVWKISVAEDNEAPTVLLGGRNYSGDGAETDDEEPLVNISLAEGSGFSVAFTAAWHQFHPFSRVLSLSDGTKDVLRVTSNDDVGTLSFSVRRCRNDGHSCQHDANVDVKKAIVVNATSRYLCSVSPEGKMQVFKDGRIVGRLKPNGTYVLPGQPGGLKVPAAEAKLYVARRTWMQRGKGVPPFEGFLGDICLWSREVQPANSASCIAGAS